MASASARPKVGADDTTKQRLLQAAEKFESIKGDVRLYLEVDVCLHYAPEALVGHQVRVFWPGDDAWYLARVTSYNPAIAEHAFDYDDGVHEEVVVALHRIRVPLRPSTPLPTLSPADLRTYADSLRARARKPGIKAAERKKLSQRAGELNDAADSLEAGPSDTPAASSGAQEHAAEYFPGDVVWGKVNGYPDWPALVTTRTHAQGDRPMQANRLTHGVPVCYFGTFERQILKRTSVTPFIEGVAAGFYAKTTSKKRKFAAAICEVATYLEDGELPEGMIPTNDDEDSDEELEAGEEEESVEDTRPAKKARRGRPSASAAVLPSKRKGRSGGGLLVGKSFRVLSLGRVEWIHPGYHNEKTIFPVGYRAEKVTVSPAGGPAPVPHLCEVLEGSDGAGPVFR